jgi:long-chain fatty acid transport protein
LPDAINHASPVFYHEEALMKKVVLVAVIFSFLGAGDLFANIDNLSNMSVEWIRTGNRNAATDAADIVIYNPGGITQLPDGLQVNIGNQTLIRKPKHTYDLGMGSQSHEQDDVDWLLPNVYVTYNKDNWALFGGYYIPGGGAVVDYPNGSITTDMIGMNMIMGGAVQGFDDDFLEAESIYNTLTFGGAYQINERISVALGLRYMFIENNTKAGLTGINDLGGGNVVRTRLKVDIDDEADGFGFIAGVNVNLTPDLNLGVQYLSRVALDLETDVNRDDLGMFVDGSESPRDYPGMLGLGLGYDFSDKLYGEINYSYWFQEEADWGRDAAGRDISGMAGDAQAVGIAVSYKFTPTILASAGTTYTDFMWDDIDGYYQANLGSYEVLYTDNWHLGCGVAYEFRKNMKVNLALGSTIWDDKDLSNTMIPGEIKTENSTTTIAIGFNLGF